MHRLLPLALAGLAVSVSTITMGCDAGTRVGSRDGSSSDFDGGGVDAGRVDPFTDSGPPRVDAGDYDPFDPANGCGSAAIPTERVPGSLLVVFDRSGSMNSPPSGDSGPTKWELATGAIGDVVTALPDELSAGLMLFPTEGGGDECTLTLSSEVPEVAVAPLSTSRAEIISALAASTANSSQTPAFAALRAGWDYLDTLSTPGQRGVVLVTDGAETCILDEADAVTAQAAQELADNDYLTFAVGMSHSDNNLSTLAYNGGTPRNDTCLPECTSELCSSDADCPGAGTCEDFGGFGFGFCTCASDADCVAPQTCPSVPFPGVPRTCSGDSNCCHYNATAGDFRAEFEAALEEIARRFLDSCVFDVPRGADPSTFDPNFVNVGVTFDGEERTILRRSSDASMDSWDYTSSEHESLIIQGPICERLLMGSATVEIVLGCATILI